MQISRKVQTILDIWSSGLGVVSLHCFQNVIAVEAYTREACMVEAIGEFSSISVQINIINCLNTILVFVTCSSKCKFVNGYDVKESNT